MYKLVQTPGKAEVSTSQDSQRLKGKINKLLFSAIFKHKLLVSTISNCQNVKIKYK